MSQPIDLSRAEWTVMHALWEGAPATVREVLTRTEGRAAWAYSTVKTMLDRLVEKGAVAAEARGKSNCYRPLVERDEAQARAAESLADQAFGGGVGSLIHFLVERETLSDRERALLRQLLDEESA